MKFRTSKVKTVDGALHLWVYGEYGVPSMTFVMAETDDLVRTYMGGVHPECEYLSGRIRIPAGTDRTEENLRELVWPWYQRETPEMRDPEPQD